MYSDLHSWPVFSSLEPEFISQIHIVMIFVVYSCDNVDCQLENGTCKFTLMKMSTIENSQNMKRVVDIACGCYYSIILTENGEVDSNLLLSYKLNSKMKWIDITALNNSSIAVTEVGRVYIWGVDYRGKSIIPTITSFFIPDMLTQYGPNVMLTSDLKIQVEGKCIYVHKAILKIRSLHFKNIFYSCCRHSLPMSSRLTHTFSYVVYKAYLKYLHTNIVDLIFENISGKRNNSNWKNHSDFFHDRCLFDRPRITTHDESRNTERRATFAVAKTVGERVRRKQLIPFLRHIPYVRKHMSAAR
ncbi:RCC1 and BTB domain-containing protein 1 [Atta colombica]|uniref:RCC1 and BTB domain-containing protein 1 n=1 Tax=Atta colombica TaxID=520822 RepID=A0A195BSJ2_9HYME|nr:RCC1 and BTB domain-containing protein 1 [Atta colombica]